MCQGNDMSRGLVDTLLLVTHLRRQDVARAFAGTPLSEARVAVLWVLRELTDSARVLMERMQAEHAEVGAEAARDGRGRRPTSTWPSPHPRSPGSGLVAAAQKRS